MTRDTAPLRRRGTPTSAAEITGQPVVWLDRVSRRFGTVAALDDVSLEVARGEIVGIIGRSGAGKSTLIRCINGLERPDTGDVRVDGRSIARLDERDLQPVRRRIGMIFQHFNLLAAKTVADNVALPLKIGGVPKADRARRVTELLELTGLGDKADAYPAQLSGGQKQRVGIARALAADPTLLLCDEATSALDPETTAQILDLLLDINRRFGLTIVLITHEMEVVRRIGDTVVVLEAGRVVEQGPVADVFVRPRAAITRSFLQSVRPQLPETLRAALRPDGDGDALIEVSLAGDDALRPLIADLALATGVTAGLVHGGVGDVRGVPIATLFLSVPAQQADRLDATLAYIRPRSAEVALLGRLPALVRHAPELADVRRAS
jgi:D-methionine transport system ATP-binding protein